MDSIIDELLLLERRALRAAAPLSADETTAALAAVNDACDEVARSWSGSWLGYHSRVYYQGFVSPPPGAVFSSEWGFYEAMSSPTRGDWAEYSYDAVVEEILGRAGGIDLGDYKSHTKSADAAFDDCKMELLATIDALIAEQPDKRLQELRDGVSSSTSFILASDFVQAEVPKGSMSTRDPAARRIEVPAHLAIRSQAMSVASHGFALQQLAKSSREARVYLTKRLNLKGKTMAKTEGKIFIGHGHSTAWRELKDFLQDRLGLTPIEFNLESAAGVSTTERLVEMLELSTFAFLVMTAEDEHADSTRHARENVVHEAGLFQGRLGFRRAIILLEEGCSAFSNVNGLGHIRFEPGKLLAQSEEIRRVLERESLL